MAISYEDFCDVFLLFLFLFFTFIKIPTLRNFSTSVEIPSDRWPYNLTPSYPFYEHVSTTRSYLVYPRHLYISISKARAKFRHYTISWKVLVERATLPRFSINPRSNGRCMHFRYAYNGHAFDDHVKESDNRLSIGVNGFRVWWYGVENSRREFSSVSRTRRV